MNWRIAISYVVVDCGRPRRCPPSVVRFTSSFNADRREQLGKTSAPSQPTADVPERESERIDTARTATRASSRTAALTASALAGTSPTSRAVRKAALGTATSSRALATARRRREKLPAGARGSMRHTGFLPWQRTTSASPTDPNRSHPRVEVKTRQGLGEVGAATWSAVPRNDYRTQSPAAGSARQGRPACRATLVAGPGRRRALIQSDLEIERNERRRSGIAKSAAVWRARRSGGQLRSSQRLLARRVMEHADAGTRTSRPCSFATFAMSGRARRRDPRSAALRPARSGGSCGKRPSGRERAVRERGSIPRRDDLHVRSASRRPRRFGVPTPGGASRRRDRNFCRTL